MPIRPIKTPGKPTRFQADYSNKKRNVQRTKRTFDTRGKAKEWLEACGEEAHARLLGRREQHTFGEALVRSLVDAGTADRNAAQQLRWPVWEPTQRRWVWLEDILLSDDVDDPNGIVPMLAAWHADLKQIRRRRYLGKETYHQRPLPDGSLRWYHQPHPVDPEHLDARPKPRQEVTDAALVASLEADGGRGPYESQTLRIRQILARCALDQARRTWKWLKHNLADLVELEAGSNERLKFLLPKQQADLLQACRVDGDPVSTEFADLVEGYGVIGWRRSNVQGLTWPQVIWPVFQEQDGQQLSVSRGIIMQNDPDETKAGNMIAQPMTERIERLLRRRFEKRNGDLVFHQGDGRPWKDTRRRWANAKARAGIDPDFHVHDLRHTWASELARQPGANLKVIQQAGGWKSEQAMHRYLHLLTHQMYDQLNLPAAGGQS